MYHVQDDMCPVYHLDANANTETSLRPPLSLSHPLQYTTDDLDYSQFYDYSEGVTDIVPTDEYSEPQVNGKGNVFLCDLVCVSQCCVLHADQFSGNKSVKQRAL